jgi:hypothetical protein
VKVCCSEHFWRVIFRAVLFKVQVGHNQAAGAVVRDDRVGVIECFCVLTFPFYIQDEIAAVLLIEMDEAIGEKNEFKAFLVFFLCLEIT